MTIQFNNNTDTVTATGGTLNAAGGSVAVAGTSSAGANLKLYEDTDNGTNYVAFKAPDTIAADVTWTLPNADGTNGQVLSTDGSGTLSWASGGDGSGDVVGPASATDNAIARYDGTTGKLIQNSGVAIDDSNNVTGIANLSFNSGYGSSAVAYGCRAWVNFNGTGTPAIRASGNVSSITDLALGKYTINFSTALTDADYSMVSNASSGAAETVSRIAFYKEGQTRSTSAINIDVQQTGATNYRDNAYIEVAIFR
jgi:hypothetical protein